VGKSIGLGVGYQETVELSPSRANGDVYLVVGDHVAEIRLERVHVEALRDQIPGVLAELDSTVADNAACDRANEVANRAVELAASVLDQAVAAELAGRPERSAELRSAADKLRAAVDAAVSAVDWAYREVG
jgi:hypothetical protein